MVKLKTIKFLDIILEWNRYFFKYTLITYLVLLLIEIIFWRSVTYFINLYNFLLLIIISGLISVFIK